MNRSLSEPSATASGENQSLREIDYSPVRRMPTVKFTGQTQGTTTNTMPTSTSLQDISAHHKQKFNWNHPIHQTNGKEQRSLHLSKSMAPARPVRQLTGSHSDDRIFEHPEVTIKSSALDEEIQKRLSTLKASSTTENLLENNSTNSESSILEHPDMRSPMIMLTQQNSSSSSALLISQDHKRVIRQQSADVYATIARTPSPSARVEFFIDNNSTSKQSVSPVPVANNLAENLEHDVHGDMVLEYSKASSKANHYSSEMPQLDQDAS